MPIPLATRVSYLLTCQCATQRNGVVVVVSRSAYTLEKWCCNLAFGRVFVRRGRLTLSKNGVATATVGELFCVCVCLRAVCVCVCVLAVERQKKKRPEGRLRVLALVQVVAKCFKYS